MAKDATEKKPKKAATVVEPAAAPVQGQQEAEASTSASAAAVAQDSPSTSKKAKKAAGKGKKGMAPATEESKAAVVEDQELDSLFKTAVR